MTALKGADGNVYAIAQGNLVVGGLGVEGADGSSTIKGTPTVGRIPNGATVEKSVKSSFLENDNIVLNLHQADFSQADKIANTINNTFGPEVATPIDSTSIKEHLLKLHKRFRLLVCLKTLILNLLHQRQKLLLIQELEQLLLEEM